MANGTKKVVKNSIMYSIAQVLTKASGLLLLPIYTNVKYLTEPEYGEYSLLSQFVTVAVFFVNLALHHAMIRFYSDYKDNKEKCKRLFGTIITFISLLGITLTTVFFIFRKPLVNLLFTGIDFFPGVFLAVISLLFNAVYLMYQGALQAMEQGSRYSKNNLLYIGVHIFLNLVFIIGLRDVYIGEYELGGVNGMMIAYALTNIIFAVYGVIYLMKKRHMVFCIDKEILKMSLKYSLPMLPHNLANNMAGYIPKLFLNKVSKALTAIYSVSVQFSSAIDVVQISINTALRPWFNDNMKHGEEGKKAILDFTMIAFKLSVIVCLAVGLFSQEVILIIANSEKYYEAWKIVPFFAATHAVKCIYYNHTLGIMYDLRVSKYLFFCSGGGTAVNFILTYLFVNVLGFGMWGAATAFLISRIVAAALTVILCRKYDIIRFPLKEMILGVLASIVFNIIGIVPVNYFATNFIYGGNQIPLFSSWYFINALFKLVIFALGIWLIVGNQKKELINFVKSTLLKKK